MLQLLKRPWLPLMMFSFLTPGQEAEIGEGMIQGVVLEEGRRPVQRANVHAELKGLAMAKKISTAGCGTLAQNASLTPLSCRL